MDVKNTIKNLHPLEIKVLLKYSAEDELTSEKLQNELGYKEGHANQAFSWLSGKGLLKEIRRTPHTFYEITDFGRAMAQTGTVEQRMVDFLQKNGAHTMPEIAKGIGLEQKDVGSAFGPLVKEGVLKMNAEKKVEYTGADLPARITVTADLIKKGCGAEGGLLNKDEMSAGEVEAMNGLAKKCLITGGAGFIGSQLARRLLKEGAEVTVLDNLFTGSKSNIYDLLDNPRFTFLMHDVTQPFWGQFDEIYNLACPASPIHYQRNPVETIKVSFLGMMNTLDLALKTKARVFHTSTSEVYGDPDVHPQPETYWGHVNTLGPRSCYDEGKRAAEALCADYVREYGVDVRMIRIFNTYGPFMHPRDGRVVSNFVVQTLRGMDLTLYGDGSQSRSFQYIDDLLDAIHKYMALPLSKVQDFFKSLSMPVPVLNIGNPGEFTIKELAEMTLALIPESKGTLVYKPLPADDPKRRRPDITLAKELLGWEPRVALKDGLPKTIEYFRGFLTRS